MADNWRIDRIGVATTLRRPAWRAISAARVLGPDGAASDEAHAGLERPDDRYVETRPGHRFTVAFASAGLAPGSAATFFLRSRGYYTEWIRGKWMRPVEEAGTFAPSDAALGEALARWRAVQADFERRFEATRLPVR